mmetsp:Transcript_8351/g.15104  ORF Transcript_8351/g.15104 Transcript_8351/m.15104 type:complete len:123 (-) Transcript_8351:1155-1523(-)
MVKELVPILKMYGQHVPRELEALAPQTTEHHPTTMAIMEYVMSQPHARSPLRCGGQHQQDGGNVRRQQRQRQFLHNCNSATSHSSDDDSAGNAANVNNAASATLTAVGAASSGLGNTRRPSF